MAGIEEYLNKIKNAVYGRDVRQAIHDGIHQCYEDGKAGAVDLVAREEIAQLIAPSGEAPSAAEVTDARVGASGVVYASLGEAIRQPIGNLNLVHNALANSEIQYVVEWETGGIDTSGADISSGGLRRTGFISLEDSKMYGVVQNTSGNWFMFEYDSSQTFIKRTALNSTSKRPLAFDANTAYIRFSRAATIEVTLFAESPFAINDNLVSAVSASRVIIPQMSQKCIHHDNFARTMTGWNIGKNSEGSLTDNSYELITGETDDGIRVDNGLTISADSSRSVPFTLREISAEHSDNFMVEFNAPENGKSVYIAYDVKDALNFKALTISYNGTYYSFIDRAVINGAFVGRNSSANIYKSLGYVIQLYFISNVLSVFIDDKYVCEFTIESIGKKVAIGNYKASSTKLDFINVFDMITPLVYNTEYLTDNGVSALPDSTISANPDRYSLNDETTRFSNKSEKFSLYSTDEKINNGKRTERSLVALLPNNLRTMRYEFDVYFPSSVEPDTKVGGYADIFFQLHDRQTGVARGNVPFHLSLCGNEIWLGQSASSEQASQSLDVITSGFVCGEVTYDEWMHFELYIKERYEERQHPFLELKINGETVYQSRKPNCANDVKGTSAQYGEYKNTWGLITHSERYIDNFKVTY